MISNGSDTHPAAEFVFGMLSTPEGRVRRARTLKYGFYHDGSLEPLDPRPGEPVTITAHAGPDVSVKSATLCYTVDGSLPQCNPADASPSIRRVPMARTRIEWDTLGWGFFEHWSAQVPGQPAGTKIRYSISATTQAGDEIYCPYLDTNIPEIRDFPALFDQQYIEKLTREKSPRVYEVYADELEIPAWLQEAVIYQIFVDRFAPDPGKAFLDPGDLSGFYGGTLAGIRSKLEYLHKLGITCLWLTPIFPSPSHHGYDATDYGAVEPRLGTREGFRQLAKEAHRLGIRVLLDFAANHISNDHPAFLDARQNPKSPRRAWFYFKEYPDSYECFYAVREMPVVNTDQRGVRDYLIQNAVFWLQQGCDGFRLDHAHGATHAFWSEFRAACRQAKPDCATFGEVTDTPAVMQSFAGRMDGCLDFQLLDLLRSFFAYRRLAPSQFDRALHKHFAFFGRSLALPSFLDNHDMNRFLWAVQGDQRKLRLAALCQFTLPGPPVIYYGTEVGLSQLRRVGRLEESRLPMPWGEAQDRALLGFYKRLTALRQEQMPAWCSDRQTILVDDAAGVYGYQCADLIVLLNNGETDYIYSLEGRGGPELIFATGEIVALQAGALRLPACTGAVLRAAR